MANLHVRDVDDTLVRKLRQRARANGRSVAEEHRQILRDALLRGNPPDVHALAAQLRADLRARGYRGTPAEELIREDRDSR
jgi:plasmid stability protein